MDLGTTSELELNQSSESELNQISESELTQKSEHDTRGNSLRSESTDKSSESYFSGPDQDVSLESESEIENTGPNRIEPETRERRGAFAEAAAKITSQILNRQV